MKAWRSLYTVLVIIGVALIPVVALFSEKVRRWWQGQRTITIPPSPGRPLLWLHCASVGEFEQGRPVLEYILQKLPYRPYVVITFFSVSGWERYRQSYPIGDCISPLPIDLPWVMRRWIRALQPKAVFFVKYDLWPNLLHELQAANCPAYLLAAHVEPLRGLRWWWKKQLFPYLRWIFVQTQGDLVKLSLAGFRSATVAGDSRLARVRQVAENWLPVSGIQEWIQNHFCIIAGSVWEEDVRFLARSYEFLRGQNLRWILVPHEVSPKSIEMIHKLWPVRCIQYSHPHWEEKRDTLILDKVGLLAYLYAYADAVWIGGGFRKGIHNILEAIIYKKAVFFGPKHADFSEANELIQLKVAESCKHPVSFSNAIKSLIKDRRRLQVIAKKIDEYLSSKPNTPEIVWDKLKSDEWTSPSADKSPQENV
ncbi:MAG: glycosyltransferase N-terminal domain-containing protein [Bacteroidia bacterium]|nr:hypothetical protein [Bacteroidia bacterium]MDW8015750.1 glycosyltransferase N-terminal domain-containing protein [Bacteroidia bacterium]